MRAGGLKGFNPRPSPTFPQVFPNVYNFPYSFAPIVPKLSPKESPHLPLFIWFASLSLEPSLSFFRVINQSMSLTPAPLLFGGVMACSSVQCLPWFEHLFEWVSYLAQSFEHLFGLTGCVPSVGAGGYFYITV